MPFAYRNFCLLLFVFSSLLPSSGFAAARTAVNGIRNALKTPYTPYYTIPIVEEGSPEDRRLPETKQGSWQSIYAETGLTFVEYITSGVTRPQAGKNTIYLKTMGYFQDKTSLRKLQLLLSAYFALPVKILPRQKLPAIAFINSKRKYDADELLLQMRREMPDDAFVYAALTDKDMFSGRLSSVFGLSYYDLKSCVVSSANLLANPDSVSGQSELLRLFKVLSHEICHALGLPHCAAHVCSMNGTMGLRDIEKAPLTLCGPCLRKVQWNIGFDNLKRLQSFAGLLKNLNYNSYRKELQPKIRRLLAEKQTAKISQQLALYHPKIFIGKKLAKQTKTRSKSQLRQPQRQARFNAAKARLELLAARFEGNW